MENINKSLEFWLSELQNFEHVSYEGLPDIELYMDQVITYLEKQLNIFTLSSLEKQITSSMINNYVKGDVLDTPTAKKYAKLHLAKSIEIYTLKKIFSIAEIKQILDEQFIDGDNLTNYNNFTKELKEIFTETTTDTLEKLNNIEENNYHDLNNLALNLGLKAATNAIISARILNYIRIKKDLSE